MYVGIQPKCPDSHFTCFSNRCIDNDLVCDEKFDCQQGEDEINCGMLIFSIFTKCDQRNWLQVSMNVLVPMSTNVHTFVKITCHLTSADARLE